MQIETFLANEAFITKKKLNVQFPHKLRDTDSVDRISSYDSLLKRKGITVKTKRIKFDEERRCLEDITKEWTNIIQANALCL